MKLFRGSILITISVIIQIAIGFFMLPFLVHNLGDKTYGLWVLVMTFLDYYVLLRMGFSTAVVRFLAKAIGEKDEKGLSKITSTSFFIYLGVSVAMLIFTIVLIFGAEIIIKNPSNLKLFQVLILILGINTALSPPLSVYGAILNAYMNYSVSKIANIVTLLIKNGLILFAVKNGSGLLSIAWIYLICNITVSAFHVIYVSSRYPFIKIKIKYFDKTKFKTLFSFSFFTFIAQLADTLRFKVDTIVITTFIGLAAVTHYNVGFRLIVYFIMFFTNATGIFQTYISQEEGAGNYQSIRDKFMFMTKLSSYIAVFIGLSFIFYGKAFIIRWMGESYSDAYMVLLIISIATIIFLAQFPTKTVLYGISKNKFWAYSNIIEGILNIILSLIFVQRMGISGVALGTAIPMIIMKLIIQPIYISRILHLDIKYYYSQFMMDTLKPAIFMFLFFLIARQFLVPSYMSIFIIGLIQTALFVAICYLFFFNKEERLLIRGVIR
ncbi:MAG: oligosaccharide flippase family protein [Candidatus Cloacimonetes bacterium]|nr:oligosaccharide flippase family protein [Candidatus Cloacimonadota bacterium]